MKLSCKVLNNGFRSPETIIYLKKEIKKEAQKLSHPIQIMEVCGGHTHTIMKYGLQQIIPKNISFIHGPGCPVCVIPKERIDHAYILAMVPDVILVTLGDMIKVPGSNGSLQDARAKGADVRFVYSPRDVLKIAEENPFKKVIFFAIGFETTTPMTAALVKEVIEKKFDNVYFHINHVSVPEPMRLLLESGESQIDAFIAPSHVSVIEGSKIYEEFAKIYHKPVVVAGFEPVDVMQSVLMLLHQFNEKRCEVEIEYSRCVSKEGNLTAQKLNALFFEKRKSFPFRGLGDIPYSALKLKDTYAHLDAEKIYADILPNERVPDHPLCICGDILKGVAKPDNCKVFGSLCKPSNPLGSCMVSSEGACAAYYKYGNMV